MIYFRQFIILIAQNPSSVELTGPEVLMDTHFVDSISFRVYRPQFSTLIGQEAATVELTAPNDDAMVSCEEGD